MGRRGKLYTLVAAGFVAGVVVGAWGMEYAIRYQWEKHGAAISHRAASFALEEKDFDSAMAHAYSALAHYPNWYAPYVLLGEVFAQTGNREAALVMYRLAVEKTAFEQSSPPAFAVRGQLLDVEREFLLRKIERLTQARE